MHTEEVASRPAETPAVVELKNVCRTFAGATPVHALIDCSFVLNSGDYVSITGASGSGKSTLMNLLGLLDVPTAGQHYIDGVEVAHLSDSTRSDLRGRSIGFVFQDSRLVAHRTVLENVQIGLMYGNVARRERRSRAFTALEQVGVAHRAAADPATLSGGERQRVAIARAISRRPRLLLADEPTGNLDKTNTSAILDLFERLNGDGNTIVLVTHDQGVAERSFTQLVMTDGHLAKANH